MITRSLRRERSVRLFVAVIIWLAVAYSVGWYHSITRIGVRGWPLPSPESIAAYGAYASAVSKWNPPYEAGWWFAMFVAVGWVWCSLMNITAGYFGGQAPGIMMSSRSISLASLPLAALGPVVTFFAWRDSGVVHSLYLTAARFGVVEPEPWLGIAYMAAALVTLAAQMIVHQTTFAIRGGKALAHFFVSFLLLVCVVAGAATFLRQGWQQLQGYL